MARLALSPGGALRALGLIDIIKIPPVDGGVKIIILRHPGDNILAEYVGRASWTSFLLPGNAALRGQAAEDSPSREAIEMDDKNNIDQLPAVPKSTVGDGDEAESNGRTIDVRTRSNTIQPGAKCFPSTSFRLFCSERCTRE